ncbi:MAG: Cna B-type domain-containing protein [Clostridia bacterium]|nr:Cna B-type domain-containing protein [Clostridia bacterium]
MKKNKKRILGIIFFLLLTMVLPVTAFARGAVDTERSASLTVECTHDGNGLSGLAFGLYKVADMDAYGRYTATNSFSGYSVSLEQETADGWRALAETISQYVLRDGIPALYQKITDATGHVSFAELSVGMYLVYGHRYTSGNFVYTPEPFLISLPSLDKNEDWFYDVEANCKGEGYTNPPETTAVKVLKIWDDEGHETNRPEDIVVQLLRNEDVYDTVTLNAGNNWRCTWTDLDADYKWSVTEKTVPENYNLLIAKEGITFVLTNSYKPAFTTVEVEKVWNDKGFENKRPTGVEVQLLCDGQVYDTVVLKASNKWTYSWPDLEEGHDWTVKEKSKPAGYTATITQKGSKFTISNAYTPLPPVEPELPQTGQLWWPVPVLLCLGLAFCAAGYILKRKQRDNK